MFSASNSGIQLRMFSVFIRDHRVRNKNHTDRLKGDDLKLYKHFCKLLNIKEGDDIEFFSGPPKDYPVMGYIGKSSMTLQAPKIPLPGMAPGQQEARYSEKDYVMIPDNLGYLRMVSITDIGISMYEVPNSVHEFKYEDNALLVADSLSKENEEPNNEDNKVEDSE